MAGWLDASVSDDDIFIPDYSIIRRERNRHGGGVLFNIRDCIPVVSTTIHPIIELFLIETKFKMGLTLLGVFYRPPSSDANLTDLELALEGLNPSKLSHCVFLGDINVDILSHSLPMLSNFHLTQVVPEPTRVTNNSSSLIDHVYTSDTSSVLSFQSLPHWKPLTTCVFPLSSVGYLFLPK